MDNVHLDNLTPTSAEVVNQDGELIGFLKVMITVRRSKDNTETDNELISSLRLNIRENPRDWLDMLG